MTITELQRLYDESIIANREMVFIEGKDKKQYEFLVTYLKYLLEYFRAEGITRFEIDGHRISGYKTTG